MGGQGQQSERREVYQGFYFIRGLFLLGEFRCSGGEGKGASSRSGDARGHPPPRGRELTLF